MLALTDQFGPEAKVGVTAALEFVPRLEGEYAQTYYAGIVWERHAKSRLNRSYPGSGFDAYDELARALALFDKAHELSPADDDDAILHWNACARVIDSNKLEQRPYEGASVQSEEARRCRFRPLDLQISSFSITQTEFVTHSNSANTHLKAGPALWLKQKHPSTMS